jgi:hypothetical protein
MFASARVLFATFGHVSCNTLALMSEHDNHTEMLERKIIEGHRSDGRYAMTIYRDRDHIIIKVCPSKDEQFEPFLMKLEHEILKDGCRWCVVLEDIKDSTNKA